MARTPARIAAKKSSMPATRSKKGTGHRAKPTAVKVVATGLICKKRKRRQSEATKASKRKEARGRKISSKECKEEAEPKPAQVYNDELKTTGPEWEVEKILDSKKAKVGIKYLVKWKGCASKYNTWEPEIHLRNATGLISEYDEANPSKP